MCTHTCSAEQTRGLAEVILSVKPSSDRGGHQSLQTEGMVYDSQVVSDFIHVSRKQVSLACKVSLHTATSAELL